MADQTTAGKPKDEAPTYHVDRLVAESGDFLGVDPHIAAGAFSGQNKKNFTLDEAESLIQKWLKRPVEEDNANFGREE